MFRFFVCFQMETAQRSFSLADRLLQVLERTQQSRSVNGSQCQFTGGVQRNTALSNNDESLPSSSTSASSSASNSPPQQLAHDSPLSDLDSASFSLPLDLDEELRPDPAAAGLGPADHTTITPLHWASNLGHDDCVRYLLMAGWNVRNASLFLIYSSTSNNNNELCVAF